MKDEFIETYTYRDISFPIYYDDLGQQYYTIWEGQELSFGAFNAGYKEEIRDFVDERLDTIEYIKEFPGAKLSWFNNFGYRDIQLTYRSRIIKVFLVVSEKLVNLEKIREEALKALEIYQISFFP